MSVVGSLPGPGGRLANGSMSVNRVGGLEDGPEAAAAGARIRAGTITDAATGAPTFTGADITRVRAMSALDIVREASAARRRPMRSATRASVGGFSPMPAMPGGMRTGSIQQNPLAGGGAGLPSMKEGVELSAGDGEFPLMSLAMADTNLGSTWPTYKLAGLVLGPLLALIVGFLPLSEDHPKAGAMLGVLLMMVCWWLLEVAPLGVTSLVPLVLFGPTGVLSTKATSATYFNHITFLLLGAFLVDLAIEKVNLHKRFALSIICRFGAQPKVILGAFMFVAYIMSMFCLNTSTTMMLVPFALGIIEKAEHLTQGSGPIAEVSCRKFGQGLLIGLAWASNIGGIGTLIGTAPNGVFVGVVQDLFPDADIDLNFATWMAWGVPLSLLLLVPAYGIVYTMYMRRAEDVVKFDPSIMKRQYAELGPMRFDEAVVAFAQVLQIVFWILRGSVMEVYWGECSKDGLSNKYGCKDGGGKWKSPVAGWDAGIACGAAILLFLVPSKERPGQRIMEWVDCVRLPWEQLLLFGGGFAIAGGFKNSGLSAVIGEGLVGLNKATPFGAVMAIVVTIAAMTEFTSNTATTSIMMPILAGAGVMGGVNPLMYMLPAALAASLAFMFPIATPPNAIVFATGRIGFKEMCVPGFAMNLAAIFLVSAITFFTPQMLLAEDGKWTNLPMWAEKA